MVATSNGSRRVSAVRASPMRRRRSRRQDRATGEAVARRRRVKCRSARRVRDATRSSWTRSASPVRFMMLYPRIRAARFDLASHEQSRQPVSIQYRACSGNPCSATRVKSSRTAPPSQPRGSLLAGAPLRGEDAGESRSSGGLHSIPPDRSGRAAMSRPHRLLSL